ncbi:MAG: HU family DNA-binding protein [Clostridia bacterium]|nr:HU family DNA-binding protein [Clostridia bacterium]MBR6744512.1 HU family DNA-binding protein [Clostridia bacterium]
MNKTQLIDEIVAKTGLKKKDAEAALAAFVDVFADTLVKGEKVQIAGLGSFEVKTKAQRIGRNPKTQETIVIPESKAVAFSASKTLKDLVNQ